MDKPRLLHCTKLTHVSIKPLKYISFVSVPLNILFLVHFVRCPKSLFLYTVSLMNYIFPEISQSKELEVE
uniref:Uncharacterized protein n=1 Tax=Aegilops tauschii subsp. strangulata TaxID=200361 RepID=A0A453QPD0_AEGTS